MEINPQNQVVPDYTLPQYTPCGPYPTQTNYSNPYQVIWNAGWFYIDPYQQLFNLQGNVYNSYGLVPEHNYNVIITQGSEYCLIQRAGYTDPNTGEFMDSEEIGDELLAVPGVDLIGTGSYQWNWCNTREKENTALYYLLFERDIPQGFDVVVSITDLSDG